jgi:hypothetical protein
MFSKNKHHEQEPTCASADGSGQCALPPPEARGSKIFSVTISTLGENGTERFREYIICAPTFAEAIVEAVRTAEEKINSSHFVEIRSVSTPRSVLKVN